MSAARAFRPGLTLSLGLLFFLFGAACDRAPLLDLPEARADTLIEPPAAKSEIPAPGLTAPDDPKTLAIFFQVSNRGEIDPCG